MVTGLQAWRAGLRFLTIRTRLFLLAGSLFLPCCGLIAYVISSMAGASEENVRRGLLYAVQTISGAVDAELRRYIGLAEVLARSPDLASDDLTSFGQEARRASIALGDAWIIVSDLDGKLLVNTAAPADATLGTRAAEGMRSQTRAMESGRPSVSDIFVGPVSRQWVATVDVPVMRDGRPFRCLSISMPAANYTKLLAQQGLPSEWVVGIIDSTGRYISRIPKNATNTGQFASQGWRKTARTGGLSEFSSIEGDRIVNANAHPSYAGWTVGVGIKQGSLSAVVVSTIAKSTVAAVSICGLALLLAAGIATSIARPLQQIGRPDMSALDESLLDPPEVRALKERLQHAERLQTEHEAMIQENFRLLTKARDEWSTIAEQLKLAARYGRLGTFVWDINSNVSEWSEEIEELYGLKPRTFGGTYDAWLQLVHPDDQARADEVNRAALDSGELYAEWRVILPDGSIRWLEARARMLRDRDGCPRQMIGVNIDVTSAKEADRKRELLVHELAHRVKNSLAVVQSLAHQLLPRDDAKVANFIGRLQALAAAHTSLAANQWEGADLGQLVADQVRPFATTRDQFSVHGSQLLVPAELATRLALVIHELACNASKYGALSTTNGHVAIRWSVKPGELHVHWEESGGPPVAEPTLAGFGSRLLAKTVQHLERRFERRGLTCEFDVPLGEPRQTAPELLAQG